MNVVMNLTLTTNHEKRIKVSTTTEDAVIDQFIEADQAITFGEIPEETLEEISLVGQRVRVDVTPSILMAK